MIAATIGLAEGATDLEGVSKDLTTEGISPSAAASVSRALAAVKVGEPGTVATLPSSGAGTDLEKI